MKNVRVLDCTLRDGGRIIDCVFPDDEIRGIASRLSDANVDIIEVGFIRDSQTVTYRGNSTFFTDVDQIAPFIKKDEKTMYAAFIDFGMCDIDSLKTYSGASIDAIRFGFTKTDYENNKEEVFRWANVIKNKGYKLFIQGVNSLNYSDLELLEVVRMVNDIHPYSFGIVDTYGAMYIDDVDRIYGLIDHNLLPDIFINFHSHNNYQLSFAFAQEVIKLSGTGSRKIIIDGTLGGMGKVAGNLNTELIVEYLVRKKHYNYDFESILDVLDDYIYKYSIKYKWGYSTAAMMAGVYKSHPNNVIYLTEKYRLDTKDIGKLLSMIEPDKRQRYDYDNIQKLYVEYISDKVDDFDCINELKKVIRDREILVMVPGNTLNEYRNSIKEYIHKQNPLVISVNFVVDDNSSYSFFGNQKRYSMTKKQRENRNVIVSSNVKSDNPDDYIVNYHSLINRGYKYFENSTMMLFNLLKKLSPSKISIAGFDGFSKNSENNYFDSSFQNDRHAYQFESLNQEITEMFSDVRETMTPECEFTFITPSFFAK